MNKRLLINMTAISLLLPLTALAANAVRTNPNKHPLNYSEMSATQQAFVNDMKGNWAISVYHSKHPARHFEYTGTANIQLISKLTLVKNVDAQGKREGKQHHTKYTYTNSFHFYPNNHLSYHANYSDGKETVCYGKLSKQGSRAFDIDFNCFPMHKHLVDTTKKTHHHSEVIMSNHGKTRITKLYSASNRQKPFEIMKAEKLTRASQ